MTRETKAGIVVSCSFLGLVGVVLFSKMGDKNGAMPEASDEANISLPADPQAAVNLRENEPLRMGEPASRVPEGVVRASLPIDDHNTPPAKPADTPLYKMPVASKTTPPPVPASAPGSATLDDSSLTLPGPEKSGSAEKGLAGKAASTGSEGGFKTDKSDPASPSVKRDNQIPVIAPPDIVKNGRSDGSSAAGPKPEFPAPATGGFDTKSVIQDVPGLTGKQPEKNDNTKPAGPATTGAQPADKQPPPLEFPPLPRLNSETPAAPKGPAGVGEMPSSKTKIDTAPPPDMGALGSTNPKANDKSKEAAPAPAFPPLSPPTPPGPAATATERPGSNATPPAPGNNAAPIDIGAGLVPPAGSPATKPLGADKGQATPLAAEPTLRPMPAPQSPPGNSGRDVQLGRPELPATPSSTQQQSPAPAMANVPSARPGAPLGAAPAGIVSTPVADARPSVVPQSYATNEPQVDSYDEEAYAWKPNDSFRSISQLKYRTDQYERALLLFNRNHPLAQAGVKQEPPQLQAGQDIFIPPERILKKYYAVAIGDPSSAPQPAPAPPATKERSYRVQGNGEMILDIARRTLGNAERWSEIYRLNPRFDPSQPVPAGTELILPQ
jgi:hypothetical protein